MASKYSFRGVADMSQHDKAIKQSASEIYKYQKATIQAEKELNKFQKQSKTTAGAFDTIGQSLKKGNLKGALIGAEGALNQFTSKLGISSNLTSVFTSNIGMAATGLGAAVAIIGKATQAWADYNAELAKQDQITTVTTGLKGDDANKMTDTVRALADTYNIDFREAINAANTLMTQFGINGEEAINIIKDGMQGMIIGDGGKLLTMIQQYAPAFRDAGISASQLVAVIHNTEGGIFTDENMNAIVQAIKNIRLMKDTTKDALRSIGIDGDAMAKQLNDGTITIFQALQQVVGALNGTNASSQAAGEVMQNVFGKQGVTAGHNLSEAILTLNTNLEETKRQTGEVGDAYADLQTANEKLNTAIRECFGYDGWEQMSIGIKTQLITALADVLNFLDKIFGRLSDITGKAKQADSKPQGKIDGKYIETVDKDGNVISGVHIDVGGSSNKPLPKTNKPTKKSGGGGSKSEVQYAVNSVGWLEKRIQDLQKQIKLQVDADKIDELQKKIKTAKDQLELLTNPQTIDIKELSPMSVLSDKPTAPTTIDKDYSPSAIYAETQDKIDNVMQMYNIGAIGADKAKEFIDSFNAQLQALGLKPIQVDIEANTEKVASSISEIGSAFQDLGSAMQMPEFNIMGTIAQAIANVVLGFAEAQKSPANTVGGVFTWVGAALTGLATMTSIIASIKSATAYAEGGIINGRTSIGDFNIARVNNGEMILNQRQQSHLFNLIDDNRPTSNVTVNGEWKLKGQDLYMSMRNYGKGQSKLGKNIGIK